MRNYKKLFFLNALMTTTFLAGCSGEKESEVETVNEVLVSENKDSANKTNQKETDKENKEDEKNNKEDVYINKDTVDQDKSSVNKPIKDDEIDKSNIELEESIVLVDNPVFKKSEITDDIKTRMEGKSMKENDSITYDDLSYLTITYLDYNGNTVQGEMVVHKKLADEVLDIFKEIYYAKFPIERMRLVDDYDAIDHASMINNNSSAFCYRTIAGTNTVSNHGMGLAIDINPFYNPHVLKSSETVNPPEASKYADRTLNAKGMIKKNDVVYKAFTSRGWTWGGDWNNPDYQHFEKKI